MIRGLYSAASGLVAQSIKQDVIANNIANANTPGFKRLSVVGSSFAVALRREAATLADKQRPRYPDSAVDPVVVRVETAVDATAGPIRSSENAMAFAMEGPGAFEVSSGVGVRHTRHGIFSVDSDGDLCTADGGKVQGRSGPIRVPEGEWHATSDGGIVVDGSAVDQIKIVGAEDGKTIVRQYAVEESNVNIVNEMVQMIANLRSFEANQRVVSSIDHTLDKLINEAGRV